MGANANSLALVDADGRVVTFVRMDVPDDWTPPEGLAAIPDDELPAGWRRRGEIHDMAGVRRERNERLTASDWTQVADSPVNREAWAAYRQALRDLPSIYAGEGEIPWPVAPS